MSTSKERAVKLACQAYAELERAGVAEEYLPLVSSVAMSQRGTFFGSFGSESGCFMEFRNSEDLLTPVRLSFGVRRHNQRILSRLWQALCEGWAVLRGHDTEHEIFLQPKEVSQLKDLLRVL